MKDIKILICDDHPVFRFGLKALFEQKGNVVTEAGQERDAIEKAVRCQPDMVIMDYMIPGMNGLDAIDAIREKMDSVRPGIRYILLTNIHEQHLVDQCRKMNLDGYLCKNECLDGLCRAITRIHGGETVFLEPSPQARSLADTKNPFHCLTKRELEVLSELVTGKTQKQIARKMLISIRTIEKHRENISGKLGPLSLPELTRKAFVWGVINDTPMGLRT